MRKNLEPRTSTIRSIATEDGRFDVLVAPERSAGGIVFAQFGGHAARLDKSAGGKKNFQDEFPEQ